VPGDPGRQGTLIYVIRLRLKYDGTCTENRFRLSSKGTRPFKSAGASVQSTTGSRGVRISGINAGYTMFRDSVKNTGYPLHSVVSPSLPLPALLCAITFQLDSTVGTPWPGQARHTYLRSYRGKLATRAGKAHPFT